MRLDKTWIVLIIVLASCAAVANTNGSSTNDDSSAAESCSTSNLESAKLVEWLHVGGGALHGVELRELPGTGRGLVAAEDLAAGTKILSVPIALAVPVQRTASTPLSAALLEAAVEGRLEDEKSLDGMLLAAWLLDETSKLDSRWSRYFDFLPRSLATPFNFTQAEVKACLNGLSAEEYILKGHRLLEKEVTLVQSLSSAIGLDISRDRYLWARFMSFSRTFTVGRMRLNMDSTMNGLPELPATAQKIWANSRSSDEASVLVPFADMINHGQKANCEWSYSGGHGFVVATKRPISAGEEILISYGVKQNILWLAHYGFVEQGNPGEKWDLPLRLTDQQEDGIAPVILRVDAANPSTPDELQELMDAFRDHARRLLNIPVAEGDAADKEVKAKIETQALESLLVALQRESIHYELAIERHAACTDYQENLRRLLGTWRVFAERALALVNGSDAPDDGWLTVPRYIRYARLYSGLWLTGQGGRQFAKNKEQLERAKQYGKMSFFDAVFADDD